MKISSLSLESKLPSVGTSIFSVMSALARQEEAVNLSQGFPDFDCDPRLRDLVNKALNGGYNQYAPSSGLPYLKESIAAMAAEFYGVNYNPDTEVTVTSGATEALHCAISAVVQEGDEVIVFEPAYDSYVPVIELNGGVPVFVPMDFPGYTINWDHVKKRISQKTRLIMLNSPHNPSGAVLSQADIEELTKLLISNEIYLISDEVYEHMVFDGKQHQSISRYPDLASRSFVISSFGKSFHTTGWKVGYCLAPEELSREFRKIHQFVTFSTATPFQYAIAEYMQDSSYFRALSDFYQEKRDLFRKMIQGSRFDLLDCEGTYFQSLGFAKISDEKDVDFARRLTTEHKIASIPVSVFYHSGDDHKVLRFCFAKESETLEKAAEILQKI